MLNSVLITGAARGFGRSLSQTFHARGWMVYALVRNPSDGQSILRELGNRCIPLVEDLRNSSVEQLLTAEISKRGALLDVLINNAGIPGSALHLDGDVVEEVSQLLTVHCLGALRCAKACVPFLKHSENPIIVNVTSRLGSIFKTASGAYVGEEHSYAYRIAKAAQNMLSVCMAADRCLKPIKVVSVHPGRMQTSIGASDAPTRPEESADALFRFVTGGNVPACGFIDLFNGEIPW